ncbi:phosphotransferase [Paenibacillus lautus]|uniref:phosphotransferase n=1 Tax=Paenibacillus lautus TaxID=1401 RepID=UPI003D28964F
MNTISDINWRDKSLVVDSLLEFSNSLTVVPLESGLEAEVTKICFDESSFVLKVWNKSSKPNVECQYMLLKALFNQGLSVSQPLGWGLDKDANQVLLTSYDGSPVMKVNQSKLINIAKILSDIHKIPLAKLSGSNIMKYEFINYFYPSIEEHKDIHMLLNHLVDLSDMKQDTLIHGDFNLGNILECEGKYTIIDWTNGTIR